MTETRSGLAGAIASADIDLARDTFVLELLRALTGAMEEIIGAHEAEQYIARVGDAIGGWLNAAYHAELGPENFDVQTVAQILVDLKDRIDGDFYIKTIDGNRIVLGNRRCPFGVYVKGRTPLCMMTSKVFGRIASENLGYARVELKDTIAAGHRECDVVIYLQPEANGCGREYFQSTGRQLAKL